MEPENVKPDNLFICETCVRDSRLPAGALSRGRQLADAVLQVVAQCDSPADFNVRVVSCLSGCLNPCNAALRCRGKFALRLSRLDATDATAIVALAKLYAASLHGDIEDRVWPASLVGKLSSRAPPAGGLASVRPRSRAF